MTKTKRQPDADLKKAARALVRELEAMPEEGWEIIQLSGKDRRVFMLQLRILAELGAGELAKWLQR